MKQGMQLKSQFKAQAAYYDIVTKESEKKIQINSSSVRLVRKVDLH